MTIAVLFNQPRELVEESEVTVVLSITKAVNELISLNLHLYSYESGDSYDLGKKVLYQIMRFDQNKNGDFDVVIHASGDKVEFIDFITLWRGDDADTHTLYSGVLQESLSEEEAIKLMKERFYFALHCYYEEMVEKLRK